MKAWTLLSALCLVSAASAQYLAVGRVGDASAPLAGTSTPYFIDIYHLNGTLYTSKSTGLYLSGTANSEGQISRSTDGRYVLIAGIDSTPGAATSGRPRAISRLDSVGAVDRATTFTDAYNTVSLRSVASVDGETYYLGGASTGGVRKATYGGTSTSEIWVGNARNVAIFDDSLYVTSASSALKGVASFSGLPTAPSTPVVQFAGDSTSPYAYVIFPYQNTAFVADDSLGLLRYDSRNGTWTKTYSLTSAVRAVVGTLEGQTFVLYAVSTSNSVFKIVEPTNPGAGAQVTTLISGVTNTGIRGIAFAPAGFEDVSGPVPPPTTTTVEATTTTVVNPTVDPTLVFTTTTSTSVSSSTSPSPTPLFPPIYCQTFTISQIQGSSWQSPLKSCIAVEVTSKKKKETFRP
jgi:hypothetical protein